MPWPRENKHDASLAFVYRTRGPRLQRQCGGLLQASLGLGAGGLSICLPGVSSASLLLTATVAGASPGWGVSNRSGGALGEDTTPAPRPKVTGLWPSQLCAPLLALPLELTGGCVRARTRAAWSDNKDHGNNRQHTWSAHSCFPHRMCCNSVHSIR